MVCVYERNLKGNCVNLIEEKYGDYTIYSPSTNCHFSATIKKREKEEKQNQNL